ncbi:hypothetical protein SLS60_005766 [Paraconiothyrium brasiliense]|uniref:Uncharacterized protein n=1 Tax=Paraconiothyrium brasiliense TaxID=300254 RepID=A0ABR3RD46_9PLEO
MPPRKQQISKEEMHSLIRRHRIRFKGPAPPKDWPGQYKHLFYVIRDIAAIRYDDYKVDRAGPREPMSFFKERVAMIRQRADDFLDNVNTNESTWRDLEYPILERFTKRVIW